MERKDFLKSGFGFLGMALIAPAALSSKDTAKKLSEAESCTVTNSETGGPFPTITPSSLVTSNIVGDRTGVAFTINITVKNINNSCNALQGAIVDIWHCDKDGNYSEYGGTAMQSANYTTYHFLRGRQTTDANGLVTYTSIFPGWYTSRATHIHVHIYTSGGTSLLITQIAFPEDSGNAVTAVNAATSYGYTKGMTGYTYNASDNVFSDGTSNEMSTITGSVSAGYVLNFETYVSAAVTGISNTGAEKQFQIGQNFPNPVKDITTIPVVLREPSSIKMELFDIQGKKIKSVSHENVSSGEQNIELNVSELSTGRYIYSVEVSNTNGTFRQSKIMIKN